MVVGGGIAGIQASLDLADSGLPRRSGRTAFGHRRCHVPVGQDLSHQRLLHVHHLPQAGGSRPPSEHRPVHHDRCETVGRWRGRQLLRHLAPASRAIIDLEKCTACGECSKVCPIDVANDFDQGLRIPQGGLQTLSPGHAQRPTPSRRKGTAPCKAACPANPSFQGCVALMAQGKYKEAFELFRSEHPFPGVCGRVCHHPCETACTRARCTMPPCPSWPCTAFWLTGPARTASASSPKKNPGDLRKWPWWAVVRQAWPAPIFWPSKGFAVTVFEKQEVSGRHADAGHSRLSPAPGNHRRGNRRAAGAGGRIQNRRGPGS